MGKNTAIQSRLLFIPLLCGIALPVASQTGQTSGELGIHLTIVGFCQVSSQLNTSTGQYQVQSQACPLGGSYRVLTQSSASSQTDQERAISNQQETQNGLTLVTLYW